jgi:outer membrane cobalamin receptor
VSRWAGGEASGTFDWLGDGRYTTLLGGEVRAAHVSSWVGYEDAATGVGAFASAYDRTGSTLSAYLQQTAHVAPWLALNAGARLDYYREFGTHVSPRAAAILPAWRGGTVKAIYSEAFRAPTFFERSYSDPTAQIAAPALRPEVVRSLEGSVEQRVGAQRFRAGAFRSWWSDLVVLGAATDAEQAAAVADGSLAAGATNVVVYRNAASVESWGVNADWDGSSAGQRLRYGAGATWARSRNLSDGGSTELRAAAQVFGNAHASYDLGGRLPTLGLALRVEGPRPVAGTNFTPVPDAPTQAELLGSVGGPLGAGVAYRVTALWAVSDRTPYAVGPLRDPTVANPAQGTLPTARWQVSFGLRWDG